LWLGDGSTNKSEFTSEDIEIISYLTEWAKTHGMRTTISSCGYKGNNVLHISIVSDKRKNMLKECLRAYGIYSNKAIPADYIYSSVEDRLKLLAGLIDTDGHFSKRDRVYTFSQSANRKHIVDAFAFIARSLGFKCTMSHYKTSGKKYIMNNKKESIC